MSVAWPIQRASAGERSAAERRQQNSEGQTWKMTQWPGRFWLASRTRDTAVGGVLTLTPGEHPTLLTESALTTMPRNTTTTALPDGGVSIRTIVKSTPTFTADTIHGQAEDGQPLTLLEARPGRRIGTPFDPESQQQEFLGMQAIVGVHISGPHHAFDGFRVRVQGGRYRLPTAAAGPQSQTQTTSAGTLEVMWGDESTGWLACRGAPRSVRMWDRAVTKPLTTLFHLAAGEPVGVLATEVLADDGAWCGVYSQSLTDTDVVDYPHTSMLMPHDLSLKNVSVWLDKAELIGPIAPVVAEAIRSTATIETQVLGLTTVAEGLHRRLHPDELRMTREQATEAKEIAVEAVRQLQIGAAEAVSGLLAHLEDVGFGTRLLTLAADTNPVALELTGKTNRWKQVVYEARNDFAHRARTRWMTEDDIDRYVCVAFSLKWLLRIRLLQAAGVPDSLLRDRLHSNNEYWLLLQQLEHWYPHVYG